MFTLLMQIIKFCSNRVLTDAVLSCPFCIQALMWASAGGHAGVVKLLLSNGADASKQKHDGKRAIEIAAFKKHRQVSDH